MEQHIFITPKPINRNFSPGGWALIRVGTCTIECVAQEMSDFDNLLSGKRDPKTLTVAELKYWLSSRGKPVKGKKDDLVAR